MRDLTEEDPVTRLGCCPQYFECPTCDRLFCHHGYLVLLREDRHKAIKVVPFQRHCPICNETE